MDRRVVTSRSSPAGGLAGYASSSGMSSKWTALVGQAAVQCMQRIHRFCLGALALPSSPRENSPLGQTLTQLAHPMQAASSMVNISTPPLR